MDNHRIGVQHLEKDVMTLEYILPVEPGLRVLFVGKVPAPDSVAAGHYFQGNQGKMFWGKLRGYGILKVPMGEKEDDGLLSQSYGMIDIVRIPRTYGQEPQADEYRSGITRLFDVLKTHKPKIVVFVYKKVLDKILLYKFGKNDKSVYGFNEKFKDEFKCMPFVFPMPGTPCKKDDADRYMKELAAECLDLVKKHN